MSDDGKRHARLSPSKGDMWVTCPGSISLIEANRDRIASLGEPGSGAAQQGTLAHSYAENLIMATHHPEESARRVHKAKADDIRPQLTKDTRINATVYADWVIEYLMPRLDQPWGLELSAPLWYEPQSKGTADFWCIEDRCLTVLDYKSGRIPVEVENNIQLLIYLIAIFDEAKRFNTIDRFRAGVMQPFVSSEPKFHEYDRGQIMLLRELIGAAAKEVDQPILGSHRLVVSEKGCRFCPAKPICPAQDSKELRLIEAMGDDVESLSDERMLEIFRSTPAIKKFLEAVEEYVRGMDEDVLLDRGFVKREGRRSFSWEADEDDVAGLVDALGVDPWKPRELKSVAQIRKELGRDDFTKVRPFIRTEFQRPRVQPLARSEPDYRVGEEK